MNLLKLINFYLILLYIEHNKGELIMKTAIYTRVSSKDQIDNHSLEGQKDKLTSLCSINDWEIVDYYVEEGVSAKNIKDRPMLKQLLKDVISGKVENVLVYKLDRLTRSTKDLLYLIDYFQRSNCKFNSFSDHIDTSTATGRMFIKILGVLAEMEREQLAERVSFGYEQKAKKGEYSNTNGIFGYDYINGKGLKVNTRESLIVNEIFELFIDGKSTKKIAELMSLRNVTTKRGGQWKEKTISDILTNPTYIGKIRRKGEVLNVVAKHEPIVSNDLFNDVQLIIKKKRRFKTRKTPKFDAIFSGVLVCGVCGSKMRTDRSISNGKYYIKHKCLNASKGNCNSKGISQIKLEKGFLEFLRELDLPQITNTSFLENNDYSEKVETFKQLIDKTKKIIRKIQYAYFSNEIEKSTFLDIVNKEKKILNEYEEKLSKLIKTIKEKKHSKINLKQLNNAITFLPNTWSLLENEAKRKLIDKFFYEISVKNSNDIYLNIKMETNIRKY